MTDFSNVCAILSHLYSEFRYSEEFEQFVEINDIGLPLAYFANDNLCEVSSEGVRYISATWDDFLDLLEIEDTGFKTLDDILVVADK